MIQTDAALKRISSAVEGLLFLLDQEIENTVIALKSSGTVNGPEVAKALEQCLRFASLREQARSFMGYPIKLPEGFSFVTPSPEAKQPPQPAKQFALTRVETAKALGVSPVTVDRLVIRGLLRPSRATRRPLFAPAEIERFMKETAKGVGL